MNWKSYFFTEETRWLFSAIGIVIPLLAILYLGAESWWLQAFPVEVSFSPWLWFVLCLFTAVTTTIAAMIPAILIAWKLSDYPRRTHQDNYLRFIELFSGIPTVLITFLHILLLAPIFIQKGFPLFLIILCLLQFLFSIPVLTAISGEIIRSLPIQYQETMIALGATPKQRFRVLALNYCRLGFWGAGLVALDRSLAQTALIYLTVSLLTRSKSIHALQSIFTDLTSTETIQVFLIGTILAAISLLLNFISSWLIHLFQKAHRIETRVMRF
ncbi:MAG: ABC transporter permease subunit [Bacteroidia bacterium]|nr:ABC transporter permease subunit [Bacteroidia bacterium]